MKKFILIIATILVAFFTLNNYVYAEDDDNDKCTSVERNDLIKKASNVVATYEFVYNEINEAIGFEYIVYNVPSGMKAEYYFSEPGSEKVFNGGKYVPVDPETGIGKVKDLNITDAYKVVFKIFAPNSNCGGTLKTVSFNKVKYNEYSDLDQCKYEGMENFTYCQQWIEKDFPYDRLSIIDRIDKQLESVKKKSSDKCIFCEENETNNSIYETIVKIRKYAIIGLSVGIVIDFIMILVSIKRVKESRL